MPRIAGHRMRFYRRNFKRMYPDAGEQSRRQLARALRWQIWARIAFVAAVLAGLVTWLAWGLR